MSNTKVSKNNPDKESIINKSTIKTKDNNIIKNKTTQNKKITSVSKNPNQSFDDISNEIFSELISKRISLLKEIKDLETKKNELDKEIESNFKGQSDNIAKRVKGFQEYLTGSLQNLSQNIEKLELVSQPIVVKPSPLDEKKENLNKSELICVPALSETFKPDEQIIRSCFSTFTKQPDFYSDPWKLRRSLDFSDIEVMDEWFFNMGGRGSVESRGSRQKNALLSAG